MAPRRDPVDRFHQLDRGHGTAALHHRGGHRLEVGRPACPARSPNGRPRRPARRRRWRRTTPMSPVVHRRRRTPAPPRGRATASMLADVGVPPARTRASTCPPWGRSVTSPTRNPPGRRRARRRHGRPAAAPRAARRRPLGRGGVEHRRAVADGAGEHVLVGERPPVLAVAGPMLVRPRLGLRPTRPQHDAGMRIEPPMSLPCATGTMPAATAAADPPLEPPGDASRSHGLCVGPCASGSVVGDVVSSGTFVRPSDDEPGASRNRRVSSVSASETQRVVAQEAHAVLVAVARGVLHGVLQQDGHASERPVGQRAGRLGPGPLEARVRPARRAAGRAPRCGRWPRRPAPRVMRRRARTSSACAVASSAVSSTVPRSGSDEVGDLAADALLDRFVERRQVRVDHRLPLVLLELRVSRGRSEVVPSRFSRSPPMSTASRPESGSSSSAP